MLRERNTFKLYVCPVSRGVFLAALIVARMIMMALSALVLLTVARVAFGIALPIATPDGLRALPIVLLGAAMVLSIGVLLASRTSRSPPPNSRATSPTTRCCSSAT